MSRLLPIAVAALLAAGCMAPPAGARAESRPAAPMAAAAQEALLDEIERAHFRYFVDHSDPVTGLTKDRSTPASAASIAAVGFALTAWPIAAERGWVPRAEAAAYARKVLDTLWRAPQGPAAQGVAGHKGWFYHFLDPKTGHRAWNCELSTVDTALLMAGVRFARTYFDRPAEAPIRDVADRLFARVDLAWARDGGKLFSMGWTPEKGFLPYHWKAYNESMILLLLALGHPRPLPPAAWQDYMAGVAARPLHGETHVPFGPHFGHQYSHAWIDFRGIDDATTRRLGFDWFENARRATRAQRNYAVANPKGWQGYGPLDWGLTACDGPGDTYAARGIEPHDPDDGTIAPTAAAASLPYAPDLVLPTLAHWRRDRPELWGPDGFADAFNPTRSWVDRDRLGIDQGPIVLMIENHRTGLAWDVMKRDPVLRAGLARAGFTGGWLTRSR